MGNARYIRLPRPEAGAERDVIWSVHHNCLMGKALRADMGEDIDELIFPVGLVGYEMPLGTPFKVDAADECRACGKYLAIIAEWIGPKLYLPRAA
jgi:hypothetical protein